MTTFPRSSPKGIAKNTVLEYTVVYSSTYTCPGVLQYCNIAILQSSNESTAAACAHATKLVRAHPPETFPFWLS